MQIEPKSKMSLEENQFDKYNLEKWDKVKYFAFKKRNKYPNLFFYYFNEQGIVNKEFSDFEKNKIKNIITNNSKKYNGLFGYFSLMFTFKCGLEIFKFISKLEIFSASISFPCIQEGKPFNEEIRVIP